MSSRDLAKRILSGDTINREDMLYPLNVLFQLQELIKEKQFKVSVNKLTASNSITWVVAVDHPLRPKDAMPCYDCVLYSVEAFKEFMKNGN